MLTVKSAHRKDITTGISDMQHRHFATIATIIREMDKSQLYTVGHISEMFAIRLARTNPNFDCGRFLRACKG